MSSLNKVMLIGRLGKDPEAYHFGSGRLKVSFPLATSDSYTNKEGVKVEETEWHNVVMWSKQAEIAEKYLRKGKLVFIEGRIKTRTWDDKGIKRYATEIEAAIFTMLSTGETFDRKGNNPSHIEGAENDKESNSIPATENDKESNSIPATENDKESNSIAATENTEMKNNNGDRYPQKTNQKFDDESDDLPF